MSHSSDVARWLPALHAAALLYVRLGIDYITLGAVVGTGHDEIVLLKRSGLIAM